MSDYKTTKFIQTIHNKINNNELLNDTEQEWLKNNSLTFDEVVEAQANQDYEEYAANMRKEGLNPMTYDKYFKKQYGEKIENDKIEAYANIDEKLFDAMLKDHADSLEDKTEKAMLQNALEQGLFNQEEKNAIYKDLVEKYLEYDGIPPINDNVVEEQIEAASGRLAEEAVKQEKGFLDFSWYLNPDFYNKQQVKEQQNKITDQLKARTFTGAAPPETDTGKGKKDLGEGYVDTQQCYLLNGVETIATEANKNNGNGNFGGRIARVRSDKPEMFFNNMGFPAKSNENLYDGDWNNFPNYFFYVTTRDEEGKNQKVDVRKAFLNDKDVNASITAVDISFNGTNPASARSDIKVDIEITFEGGLNLLNTTLDTTGVKKVGSEDDVEGFKVVDIIIRPEFMRDGKGLSSYERKQYHPDYNRTELVLESIFVPGADGTLINIGNDDGTTKTKKPEGSITSYISFGLAMVDHEVNYTTEAGGKNKTVIKLSYYSYVQTFLNLPYMDALGGRDILTNRQNREGEMKTLALTAGKNVLKEKKRKNKKISIQEIQDNKSRIVKEIMKAGLLYKTEVTDDDLEKIKKRAETDNYGYVGEFDSGKKVERVTNEAPSDKAVQDYQNDAQYVYFFTLADLVAVLSDIFYNEKYSHTSKSSTYHRDFVDKLKPKFLFLDIMVEDRLGNTVSVNLGDIPISIEWFSKFLEENYFKKEVIYAPFMSFLNTLIENAFTKMIKETCFKDDPWDGNIRVTSFRALEGAWAWGSLFPNPYLDSRHLRGFSDKLGKIGALEEDYNTIIVIHANKQGDHTRLIKDATNKGTSIDALKEFPLLQDKRIVKGSPVKGSTLGIFLNFSKADAQYLRESRYFQHQADEFVAIGNVYNCTVQFKNNIMNWFLPGHIVIIDPYTADDKPWNNSKSIGNRIGMTGFYLVTNVKHKLLKNGKDFVISTTLETKWIASVTGEIRGGLETEAVPIEEASDALDTPTDQEVNTSTLSTPNEDTEKTPKLNATQERRKKRRNSSKPK